MSENEKNITAVDILGLLAERYCDPRQFVTATEVSPQTGGRERRMDFIAVHCWNSEGFKIEAFEIKISKPDMKRELMDPSKHNVFFNEIDTYSLVAPDYVLDNLDIIPPKWGVYKVVKDGDSLKLVTARKPMALHDEHVSERKIGRPFFASLLRAVNTRSTQKASAASEMSKARAEIQAELERKLTNGARIVPEWTYDNLIRHQEVCEKLGINRWSAEMAEWQMKAFKDAQHVAERLGFLQRGLKDSKDHINFILKMIKGIKELGDIKEVAAIFGKACDSLKDYPNGGKESDGGTED